MVVCDDESKVKRLAGFGMDILPTLAAIVHMDPVCDDTRQAVERQGWELILFSDLEVTKGKNIPVLCLKPIASSLYN